MRQRCHDLPSVFLVGQVSIAGTPSEHPNQESLQTLGEKTSSAALDLRMSHSHGHTCESEADHDHDHDHSPPPEDTNEAQSLYHRIKLDAVRALNEEVAGSGSRTIRPWSERFSTTGCLKSDSDEQIIIHIPFDGQIKLKSILMRCSNTTSAVKDMKVYVNRDDLDFDTIADAKPTETFECVAHDAASDLIMYPVKARLYNNVNTLTLFFEHNWSNDEEPTVVSYLGFRGELGEVRGGPIAITYEAYANPKDHKIKGTEEMVPHSGV